MCPSLTNPQILAGLACCSVVYWKVRESTGSRGKEEIV